MRRGVRRLAASARGVGALALLCTTGGPLVAQSRPAAPSQDTVFPLPRIVISAVGPTLPLARVPYAVAAVDVQPSASSLSLASTLARIPGVEVDDRHNYSLGDRISIRGFGARSQFGVRGVVVRLDGLPLTLPDGQTTLSLLDPAFLERVEALRGPASALYGNAAGGVLLLETQAPSLKGGSAGGEATAGSWGLGRLAAAGGAGWGGGGVRANASRVHLDGYRRFSGVNVWRGHGRVRVALPGESSLDLMFDGTTYNARNPGSLSDSLLRLDRRAAFATNVADRTGETADEGQIGFRLLRPLGGVRLDIAGYGRRRRVDNPIPFRVVAVNRHVGGVEVRVGRAGADRPRIGWSAGAELALQSDLRQNFTNEAGERGDVSLDQRERVGLTALFARLDAEVRDKIDVLAGVRYDAYHFRAIDYLVSETDPDDSGRRTMSAWSPTFGVDAALAPWLDVYANVATAFETPTTSELANRPSGAGGFNPALEPQRTNSVEAGVKGFARARIYYEIAAYRARVRDELVPFEVADLPGRQYFRNVGSAVHRGLEAMVRVASRTLEAHAGYTFIDARFDDYVLDGVDLHGNRVPGVAPHRLEVGAAWRRGGARAALSGQLVGATPVNDANSASSPSYFVLDIAFDAPAFSAGSARAAPFLAVDNLLDRAYNGSVVVNAFGGRYYEPAPGRTLRVGARIRLGAVDNGA